MQEYVKTYIISIMSYFIGGMQMCINPWLINYVCVEQEEPSRIASEEILYATNTHQCRYCHLEGAKQGTPKPKTFALYINGRNLPASYIAQNICRDG